MKIKLAILPGRCRSAAFSLVETTVGLGILGMVAGAMLTGLVTAFFSVQLARENLRATQIMLDKVETLRLYDWYQLTNNVGTNAFTQTNFVSSYYPYDTNKPGLTYTGTLEFSVPAVRSSYSNNLRQVKVTLKWKTGNLNRTRSFTTFVARDGLQNYVY